MRPVLKPALRRTWRGPATLQLGVTPPHALVLHPADDRTTAVLDLLDGTRSWEDLPGAAAARGVPGPETHAVLDLLRRSGALDDAAADHAVLAPLGAVGRARLAPDLASLSLQHPGPGDGLAALGRRRAAGIEVRGGGRVGAAVVALLSAAGVGRVALVDDRRVRPADLAPGGWTPEQLGRRRSEAAAALLASDPPAPELAAPDLVVLAPAGAAGTADCLAGRLPHLCVSVVETTAVVGPLVRPGRGPCSRCIDRERSRRDPGWAALAPSVAAGDEPATAACDVLLAGAAAAAAAAQVVGWLDAAAGAGPLPATVAGTLELTLPDWQWRRRSWPADPTCPCRDPVAPA